jgi:hypothetical protein
MLMKKMPCAVPRSCLGNQREKVRAAFGSAPASPAPKRNRIATIDAKLNAKPVSMVNADHQQTIRVRTRRVPTRSPHHPVGISKAA